MEKVNGMTDFLLRNSKSKRYYQQFAGDLPIVDYHCHLKPEEIYKDVYFANITEMWLAKDHYKWRLMRANGVQEELITGDADDYDKFLAWAQTIQRCPGNPLYQWTKMELATFFGIEEPLNQENAAAIWEEANRQLGPQGLSVRKLLTQMKVKLVGTTDDPFSSLEWHQKLSEDDSFQLQVVPTMRIDRLTDPQLVKKTEAFEGQLQDYLDLIVARMDYFQAMGCRAIDLGVGKIDWQPLTTDPEMTFGKIMKNEACQGNELQDLATFILMFILKETSQRNWVFQLHFGAVGSVNDEAKKRLGTGTGFDTITEQGNISEGLLYLFNQLNDQQSLPKTILYNIDSGKNQVVESIMGCFQANEAGIVGKMQHGPAWWFQDTYRGNRRQLEDLAEQGILMNFIGMTTDSRSFLSFTRHDYFRRILCDLVGEWVTDGLMPEDEKLIKAFIEDICYKNAARYFQVAL